MGTTDTFGSVKMALSVVFKEYVTKEEVLLTFLCEIEHAVNSRPLTHVSVDPRNQETFTPNHFLLGASSGQIRLSKCGHTLAEAATRVSYVIDFKKKVACK